jgi:hypothetical protein
VVQPGAIHSSVWSPTRRREALPCCPSFNSPSLGCVGPVFRLVLQPRRFSRIDRSETHQGPSGGFPRLPDPHGRPVVRERLAAIEAGDVGFAGRPRSRFRRYRKARSAVPATEQSVYQGSQHKYPSMVLQTDPQLKVSDGRFSAAVSMLQSAPMPGDESEIVKAGVDAALAPVKDILNRLLGPAVDELGGILAEPIRTFRFKRSVRLLEKVKRICEETGFEPSAVPLKMLLPILKNASLEDDEDLHDRWANLLANAASSSSTVRPAFPEVLRQLSPTDARFLDVIFDGVTQVEYPPPAQWITSDGFGTWITLRGLWETAGLDRVSPGAQEQADESDGELKLAVVFFLHSINRITRRSPT